MELRRAQPLDVDEILNLWREGGATVSETDSPAYVASVLEFAGAVCLVAIADGRIVGTVIGGFDGWRGNVYRLVVHPGYRRQGIARALVKQIERVFVAWGVTRVSALVEKDHPGAAKFWDALGYGRDDRMARHVATL